MQTSSFFVTLTYNTDSVPLTASGHMSLEKKHLQGFFKRLRNHQDTPIRYYAVGEYGSKTNRPHYHIIVFGLQDAKLIHQDAKRRYFRSRSVEKAWPYGGVDIGLVSGESIAYTTKYINKPGRIPLYKGDDRLREFSLMSKGLGKSYLESDAVTSFHAKDISRMYVQKDGYKIAMPRYYREKLYSEEQRDEQKYIAAQKQRELDEKRRYDYYNAYGDDTEDGYIAWLDSLKRARYRKFYSKQQQRTKI